jgi:hypothetical protein
MAAQGATTSGGRNAMAGFEVAEREPVASGRVERGIPRPEPARDPSMRAVPTPQVPIPMSPERPYSGSGAGYAY